MAADLRSCGLCGVNLAAGTATTSIHAGSLYLCTQCAASADRAAVLDTITLLPTR